MGLRGISLSFRQTQTPFRMEMIPASVDVAITEYDLTTFLTLNNTEGDQRAKPGWMCPWACVYVFAYLPFVVLLRNLH